MIAETVNADKETVRNILHDELNMKKVFAKLVSKNLTGNQKIVLQQICSNFLERLDEEPELRENVSPAYSDTKLKLSSSLWIEKLMSHQSINQSTFIYANKFPTIWYNWLLS